MSEPQTISLNFPLIEAPYPGSHYCTFGGRRYDDTIQHIVKFAPLCGVENKPMIFDDKWLIEKHPAFIESRRDLFEHERGDKPYSRGFGWFCWKPFIILEALSRVKEGDIVLFTDADTFPVHDLRPLFQTCKDEGGIMLFAANGFMQRHWCKRDCMAGMGMDSDYWRDKQHAVARFMLFQKGASLWGRSRFYGNDVRVTPESFLQEWLKLSSDIKLTTFDQSKENKEYEDLKQHRCEQAILTNLAHKYGIPLHREADESGNDWIRIQK